MSRTKGSKNKTKGRINTVVVDGDIVPVKEDFKEPTAFVQNPKPQPWEAKPEMGTIHPPAPEEKICRCLHKGAVHYGSEKRWCNTHGCNCQEFQQN